ncbi:H-NS family nucleoid-associated regulatory protein [Herminiimonas sp. CN]|uniref:H-NS histone family protein n=1 Tax=Herminiimonas sp. CN TaxID=1349818 RepID=UPI00047359BF|nr:H-NS histone family protein [Herminiimonas sp. CN]
MDLSGLSSADLRALQEQVKQELKKREQQDLTKAREQIMAIAQSVGVPLKELMGGQARAAKAAAVTKVAVRYRHPADASLQWTGRGRQPKWVQDWLASGQSLDALKV